MMKASFRMFGLSLALWSTCVSAIPMFTVTPSPKAISVLEGNSGVFNFTVKNVGLEDITISEVRLFLNSVADSIVFYSGDKNDEVFNTQIVNADRCIGKTLSTNGTCQFQQLFETRDLNKAASDTNAGIWEILNSVVLASGIPPNDRHIGSAFAEVRDPGAKSRVPEPHTLLLMLTGVLLLAFVQSRQVAVKE